MTERVLIVNADDFGLSPGVNAGVARAHEQGILTSASLMVRFPAAARGRRLRPRAPGLSLGLHVDLGEWVLQRRRVGQPCTRSCRSSDPDAVVEAEVQAGRSFRELTGREPSHIDSHQHVHNWDPVVASFRTPGHATLGVPLRHYTDGVDLLRRPVRAVDGRDARSPSAITAGALIEIIEGLPAGVTELACHPGLGDDSGSTYDRERTQEVEVLCDPRRARRRCAARASHCGRSLTLRQMAPAPARVPGSWSTKDSRCGSPACRDRARARSRDWSRDACARTGVEHIEVLDGDIVRDGLCRDLGFSREDRTENIRRIAFVSKLLTRNGVAVIVAAISPYREDRELAREEIQSFVEVWCHASADDCADARLQGPLREGAARARSRTSRASTTPTRSPRTPIWCSTRWASSPEASAERVMALLRERGVCRA